MRKVFFAVMFALIMEIITGPKYGGAEMSGEKYDEIYQQTEIKNGVREITYDQFVAIRDSGEDYILFDVLSTDSYDNGHIEGSLSLPVFNINESTAQKAAAKDSNIIVYCGSFSCSASTAAAKKLSALGYRTLDYKGGLKEWQEKGNRLAK